MRPFSLLYSLGVLLALVMACKSKTTLTPANPTPDPNQTAQTDPTSWTTLQLNAGFSIKFPSNYAGQGGQLQIDGWLFDKTRADKRATFGYAFCTPTGCSQYGRIALGGKSPTIESFGGQTLTKSKTISVNDEPIGMFYYSEQSTAVGVLYLLSDNSYRESLNVQFDNTLQAEILAIIGTIRRR